MTKDEFIVYLKLENKTDSVKTVSLGSPNEEYEGETLFTEIESTITQELVTNSHFLERFLPMLGVQYPNCWIGVELRKELIYPNWKENKPGDIDLVIGNFKDDNSTFCFENIVGVQIKVRRVTNENDLKNFSSGRGTKQTHLTSEMGFDKTLLLHILIKQPEEKPQYFSDMWNILINANFFHYFHKCFGEIRKRIKNDIFGYGLVAWGQSNVDTWKKSGILKIKMIKEPPEKPYKERSELSEHRKILLNNLKPVLKKAHEISKERPLIFHDDELRTSK